MLANYESWAIKGINNNIITHLTIEIWLKKCEDIAKINDLLFEYIEINTL